MTVKYLSILIIFIFLFPFLTAADESKNIGVVHKIIKSNENKLYLVSDNGTWQVEGQTATRLDSLTVETVSLTEANLTTLNLDNESHATSWAGIFILLSGVILAGFLFELQRSANVTNKQYMMTLRQQKRLLDVCFWVTGDTVIDCDLTQNYAEKVTDNKGFFELQGIPFLSSGYLNQIHSDDRAIYRTQYDAILAAGNNSFQLMYRFNDGQGNWKWIVERGCVLERDTDGNATRVITNLRDETELRREQTNLVRINHALEKKISELNLMNQPENSKTGNV